MTVHTVDNPFSGEAACEVRLADWNGVDRLLDRATAAAARVATVPLAERIRLVRAATGWMESQVEAIAADITRMMGKPLAQARAEVATMASRAVAVCALAPAALADVELQCDDGIERRILKLPLGVVLDIPAWNYPLLTAVNCVMPAVLAGNAVIVRHSSRTPLCGEWFARAFREAGAGSDWVQSLDCDHANAERAVADPRVDHVVFTGSVSGGRSISRAAAGRFLQIGYELGGSDAAYVAADADLGRAVAGLVDGALYNAGQSCCGVERVYVHRDHYADFVAQAQALVAAYVMGNPFDSATTLGPVAQPQHPGFLAALVDDAVTRGASLVAGGHACQVEGRGRFFEPTLIAHAPPELRLMREETFGPILAVAEVASDDEALLRMADTRFGLTASVWTADASRAERFGRTLAVGTLFMNRCDFVDPLLPWSGVGDSGRGHSLGTLGFDQLTRPRAWHFRR